MLSLSLFLSASPFKRETLQREAQGALEAAGVVNVEAPVNQRNIISLIQTPGVQWGRDVCVEFPSAMRLLEPTPPPHPSPFFSPPTQPAKESWQNLRNIYLDNLTRLVY